MSQDKPNSSESSESQPSVPQPPNTEQTRLQVGKVQVGMLRSTSIRMLRSMSQVLEKVAEKLEADPSQGEVGLLSPKQNQLQALWQRFFPLFLTLWNRLLRQIRSRLPEDLNQKLGDRALSGIVAGLAIVLFWTTTNLFSSKPAEVASRQAVPKAIAPPPDLVVPAPTSFPAELTAPSEVVPAPSISPLPEETTAPEAPSPEASPSLESSPPPESSLSPESSEPTIAEEPTPEPAPVIPAPELTPEEKLIASIQARVTEVAEPYTRGLIQSVQPNFRSRRLIVQVSDDWYTLSASQQDKLGDEVLNRSQELDFSQLKITDAAGVLLARNPVVGSSMVILRRRQLTSELS